MCVKMLNPNKDRFVIDTACGSCEFLIHTMKYVKFKNFSNYAIGHLWGIDFNERRSKISKIMMLIASDGKSYIFKENSLDSSSWSDNIKVVIDKERLVDKDYRYFDFDILLANSSFIYEVTEKHILAEYSNIVKEKQTKISRYLLFIERNLNFVKNGGWLALVLLQGVFNDTRKNTLEIFWSIKPEF